MFKIFELIFEALVKKKIIYIYNYNFSSKPNNIHESLVYWHNKYRARKLDINNELKKKKEYGKQDNMPPNLMAYGAVCYSYRRLKLLKHCNDKKSAVTNFKRFYQYKLHFNCDKT